MHTYGSRRALGLRGKRPENANSDSDRARDGPSSGGRGVRHGLPSRSIPAESEVFPVRQKVRFVARVPPVRSPSADPMRVGAILEIVNPISGEAATFDLPPAGWSTLAATGFYRFVNPAAPAGISSVRFAVIRSGSSIQVVARATGITLDEPAQGTLGVILTVGSDRYCSTCNAPSRDEPGRFVANKCAVPVACVRPPSSSTGTS